MSRRKCSTLTTAFGTVVLSVVAATLLAVPAVADIVTNGDVYPSDPNTWTDSTWGYIGKTSGGSVTIDGGSDLFSERAYIGYGASSTGTVTVSGAGSIWNTNRLYVGSFGAGELTITDGGLVSVGETLEIGLPRGGTGSINLSTGGMLAISGDADDSLADFLSLISIGGGLANHLLAIRYWNDFTSGWSSILPALPNLDYTLTYFDSGELAGHTLLRIGEYVIPGDANLDGETDLTDFNIWNASKFITGTEWEAGDFNGDGQTDLSDFNIWNANKFTVATGGAAPAPTEVPEPGTLGLLGVAVVIGLACRRRAARRPQRGRDSKAGLCC